MKILLSAFACEPKRGSEEGVGWGIAWSLAKTHEVHVLTIPRFRPAIEQFLREHPQPSLSFSYLDFHPPVLRYAVTSALWQLYYHLWQLRLWKWTRAKVASWQPDLIHHVSYGRYWSPSSLAQFDCPFIWGPIGGGDTTPEAFVRTYSPRGRRLERLRRLVRGLGEKVPSLKATARRSAVALATTPETASRLRRLGVRRVMVSAHSALPQHELPAGPMRMPNGETRFCCVGNLLHWKGFHLAIEAFAAARIPNAQLTIAGEGPEKSALIERAGRLGLANNVIFAGRLPRSEVLSLMQSSLALVHPSLHDSGGFVCLEAMSHGRPVICLKLGGPGEMVTPETGFAIPAHDPAQAIQGMAAAMRTVALQPETAEQLGLAAFDRVREDFTWEKKAVQFTALYEELVGTSLRTVEV